MHCTRWLYEVFGDKARRWWYEGLKDVEEVTFNLIKKIKKSSHQVITLYYGKDVKADDAEAFCEKVQDAHPDCDVMLQFGGQPLYYYILALE